LVGAFVGFKPPADAVKVTARAKRESLEGLLRMFPGGKIAPTRMTG